MIARYWEENYRFTRGDYLSLALRFDHRARARMREKEPASLSLSAYGRTVAKDILSGIDWIRRRTMRVRRTGIADEKSNGTETESSRSRIPPLSLSLSLSLCLFKKNQVSQSATQPAAGGMKRIKEKRNQPALSAACKSGTLRRANSAVPVTEPVI